MDLHTHHVNNITITKTEELNTDTHTRDIRIEGEDEEMVINVYSDDPEGLEVEVE